MKLGNEQTVHEKILWHLVNVVKKNVENYSMKQSVYGVNERII